MLWNFKLQLKNDRIVRVCVKIKPHTFLSTKYRKLYKSAYELKFSVTSDQSFIIAINPDILYFVQRWTKYFLIFAFMW